MYAPSSTVVWLRTSYSDTGRRAALVSGMPILTAIFGFTFHMAARMPTAFVAPMMRAMKAGFN
ncbi:hypothetical protein GCM10007388_31840 [Pseudoduganella plicata]|uniref:Uncharacterized protein n=1 Tax=Pseudoduganella plicata TaxID=321984 RepID=A0AA88C9E6_9BURK|nr:hypothetical protein GCM10007388_31840 [Pseudoduganella plicata]